MGGNQLSEKTHLALAKLLRDDIYMDVTPLYMEIEWHTFNEKNLLTKDEVIELVENYIRDYEKAKSILLKALGE